MSDTVQLDDRYRVTWLGGVWFLQERLSNGDWQMVGRPYKRRAGAIGAYKRLMQKTSKAS